MERLIFTAVSAIVKSAGLWLIILFQDSAALCLPEQRKKSRNLLIFIPIELLQTESQKAGTDAQKVLAVPAFFYKIELMKQNRPTEINCHSIYNTLENIGRIRRWNRLVIFTDLPERSFRTEWLDRICDKSILI